MNLVWKPLDLMGKRLYRVVSSFRGQRSYHVIAADAPRHAAESYLRSIGPAREQTDATGFALQVGQPAEWFEDKIVSPSKCNHRSESICSMEGAGPGFNRRYHVSICLDCGEITVHTAVDGKSCTVEFGINCDWQLRAAAKYMRSDLDQKEALARCAPHGPAEHTGETLEAS